MPRGFAAMVINGCVFTVDKSTGEMGVVGLEDFTRKEEVGEFDRFFVFADSLAAQSRAAKIQSRN